MNLPDTHIVKQMYLLQKKLDELGHNTWVSGVKKLLVKSELVDLWDNHPMPQLSLHIRGHMELLFRNNWVQAINDTVNNPKLRLYRSVKSDFSPELYLYINIEKYRIALSRLRLSSHTLAIETGRYARPIIPAHL